MRLDRMRSRQTEAGETRKGLRVVFGAQFNTRRRTVRLVCDFFLDRPIATPVDGRRFESRATDVRLLGRLGRLLCFVYFSSPERYVRGDDPRRECRRVERHSAARSICQCSSGGAFAIAGLHPPIASAGTMTAESPKVEFALGSEVSPGRFFKSAFARNFISSGRDCKSLDYELLDNVGDRNGMEDRDGGNARNNNFFSLVNFADGGPASGDDAATAARAAALWEQPKPKEVNVFCTVLQLFSFAT